MRPQVRRQLLLYEAEQPMLQLLIDELLRVREAARRAVQIPSALDGDEDAARTLRGLAATDYEKAETYASEFGLARSKVERLQNELSLLADAETQAQEQLEQLQIKVNLDHVPDTLPLPPPGGTSEQALQLHPHGAATQRSSSTYANGPASPDVRPAHGTGSSGHARRRRQTRAATHGGAS